MKWICERAKLIGTAAGKAMDYSLLPTVDREVAIAFRRHHYFFSNPDS